MNKIYERIENGVTAVASKRERGNRPTRADEAGRNQMEETMAEIICKCGARTYEEHLASTKSAHTYKPNKASNLVRK